MGFNGFVFIEYSASSPCQKYHFSGPVNEKEDERWLAFKKSFSFPEDIRALRQTHSPALQRTVLSWSPKTPRCILIPLRPLFHLRRMRTDADARTRLTVHEVFPGGLKPPGHSGTMTRCPVAGEMLTE